MTLRHLGGRIKKARQARGLSQKALADKVQLSRIYIAKLEAGERRAPSLAALERIARVLGMKLSELVD